MKNLPDRSHLAPYPPRYFNSHYTTSRITIKRIFLSHGDVHSKTFGLWRESIFKEDYNLWLEQKKREFAGDVAPR